MAEDEMVGWHRQLEGHEFEQAWGVGMDRESWHAAVHGGAKSQTQLSDQTEHPKCRFKIIKIIGEIILCRTLWSTIHESVPSLWCLTKTDLLKTPNQE